jgi:gliding motility-associated-like protein
MRLPIHKYFKFISVLILLLGVFNLNCFSQGSGSSNNNLWYFGNKAAIKFSGNGPSALLDSKMSAPEGVASITVQSNNDFIYTNGKYIYNSKHIIINPNNPLKGNPQSTQAAIIINHSSCKEYYVFTTDKNAGSNGLCYSIITPPFKANSLVSLNNKLLNQSTEKLTAIKHCNKKDYWIIGHSWNSNDYYSWLLTKDSLYTKTPIISSIGTFFGGNGVNAIGSIKANSSGTILASTNTSNGTVDLMQFDNVNGSLSNHIQISNIPNAYGVEFSPSFGLLYISTLDGKLYQYDIQNWNHNAITNSKYLVSSSTDLYGTLQTGLDDKIYLAIDQSHYLGVINYPYLPLNSCNFTKNGLYLLGRKSEAGLPQVQYNVCELKIDEHKVCIGDTSFFGLLHCEKYNIDSILWKFGDSLNPETDTSTLLNPYHIYSKPGTYEVMVYYYHCDTIDSLGTSTMVIDKPLAWLGPDTTICDNEPFQIYPLGSGNFDSTIWNTGSTSPSIYVTTPGIYSVTVFNKCGTDNDSININTVPAPVINLPNDTSICNGDSVLLDAGPNHFKYLWQNQDSSQFHVAKNKGMYFIEVIDTNGCKDSDDFILDLLYKPNVNLGSDTTICIALPITFNGNEKNAILWHDGTSMPFFITNETGTYILTETNQCGSSSDTINVIAEICEEKLWVPNAFTPNNDGLNDVFKAKGIYVNEFRMRIFNRYGDLFFESKSINEGWDGTHNNKLSLAGTYIWKIDYMDFDGNWFSEIGYVILVR